MTNGELYRCRVRLCEALIPREKVMCQPHWQRLPLYVKQHVFATWEARRRARTDGTTVDLVAALEAHHEAIDEAVRLVNGELAKVRA